MKKQNLCFWLAAALMPFTAVWANTEGTEAVAAEKETTVSEAGVPVPEVSAEDAQKAEAEAKRKAEAEAKKAEMEKKKFEQLSVRKLQMEKAKIDAEIALEQAKLRREMAPANDMRARLEVENALRQSKLAAEFAEIDEAKRTLDAVAARDSVRDNLASFERNLRLRERDLDARITRLEQELELGKCNLELTRSRLEQGSRNLVETPAEYLKEPFVDGTLYISDRRIDFNGPVTQALAEHVIERLYFYNNQSPEYPIFIVIDDSPGGSAFAGYQILKAMESSKAPVYVVVKGMAASMAAIVTTLAPNSFCYENTIILHHQASSGVSGNMTSMAEQYNDLKTWISRLFEPICKKIGKTQEEFVKDMYAHVSTGDWAAWGTDAVKMRWVNNIADRIVETSVVKKPKKTQPMQPMILMSAEEKTDERGNAYVELPPLEAGDAWLIYDPQNRYRFAR